MHSVADSTTEKRPSAAPAWRKWGVIGGGLLLGLLLGVMAISWIGGRPLFGPPRFHGTLIQSPQPAPNFTLNSAAGPVSLHDFEDKVVLLYFGYTYCPDVCPATMSELKQAVALLGRRADDVQVMLISVDPQRDTPQQLAEYVSHFHDSFIGVTGNESDLLGVATQFGIYFEKQEGTAASGYLMDHTASVTVIDKRGHIRLLYPFGTSAEDIAADLKYLVRE